MLISSFSAQFLLSVNQEKTICLPVVAVTGGQRGQTNGWMERMNGLRAAIVLQHLHVLLFMWIPSTDGFILSCVNSKCACYDFKGFLCITLTFFSTNPNEWCFDDILIPHFQCYSRKSEILASTVVYDLITLYLKAGFPPIFISLMNSNICDVYFSPVLKMSAE